MSRTDFTPDLRPAAEHRLTAAPEDGFTDRVTADDRITGGIPAGPPRSVVGRLRGAVEDLVASARRPGSRFALAAAGMGLAFAFLAVKITLLMALRREWHPFLIAVASFFACGSAAYLTAAAVSFFRARRREGRSSS